MKKPNTSSVGFLYGNPFGRFVLKCILNTHADRVAVAFLRSRLSRPFVGRYVRKNRIPLEKGEVKKYRSFNAFFTRVRDDLAVDMTPEHLISPCDALLSVFPVDEQSCFAIKGSHYRLGDLLDNEALAAEFCGGDCLIFRLCPSDYHHYCYIDDGFQKENHYIPGKLHSVQPIACETYPVYTLNRRSWTLMETRHFGSVVQTEVGALVVGGIVNPQANVTIRKGEEKGYFDLAGSTIVLFFQKDRIQLLPEICAGTADGAEYRVELGMHIGYRVERS